MTLVGEHTELTGGQACLSCGYKFDAASPLMSDAKPEPGAANICGKCGAIMIFQEDLSMRLATKAEVLDLMKSPLGKYVQAAQQTIRAISTRGKEASRCTGQTR